MSVRARILMILLLFALVPVLISGGVSYWAVSKDLSKAEHEQAAFAAQASASTMNVLGQQMEQAVKTYGFWDDAFAAVQDEDVAWIEEQINVATEDFGVDFGFTANAQGVLLSSFGAEKFTTDMSQDPLLQRILAGEKIMSGLYLTPNGLAMVGASQVMETNGEGDYAGYLVFGKYLTEDQIKSVKQLTGADITVTSAEGQNLTTNSKFNAAGKNGDVIQNVDNGVAYLTSYTPLQDINAQEIGQIATTIPANASIEAKKNFFKITIIIIIISVLVAIVIGLAVTGLITRPIIKTSELLKEVASGDFSRQQKEEAKGEIGEMEKAYNKMVNGLRTYIQGTNASAEELVVSTGVFSTNVDSLAKTSEQITRGVQEVAEMVHNVQNNSKQTADSMKTMTGGIQGISGHSQGVYELAEQTTQLAETGVFKIESAVAQMNAILKQSKDIEKVVFNLEDKSKKVSQITEVITAIASQTNLLALNAAIEAARAGEQGRGFSIVADEVRNLAEEAGKAAGEIQMIVNEIKSGTDNVTKSILLETGAIAEGAELVSQAGQSFVDIQQAAVAVTDKTRSITMETKELVRESEDVFTQIMNAEKNAVQAANSAQSIASATQQQAASVQEVAGSIIGLHEMADRLKNLSSQYKV